MSWRQTSRTRQHGSTAGSPRHRGCRRGIAAVLGGPRRTSGEPPGSRCATQSSYGFPAPLTDVFSPALPRAPPPPSGGARGGGGSGAEAGGGGECATVAGRVPWPPWPRQGGRAAGTEGEGAAGSQRPELGGGAATELLLHTSIVFTPRTVHASGGAAVRAAGRCATAAADTLAPSIAAHGAVAQLTGGGI